MLKKSLELKFQSSISFKRFKKILPLLNLSTDQVWWGNELWFKRFKYVRHDVTNLINLGMVRNKTNCNSRQRNITFL